MQLLYGETNDSTPRAKDKQRIRDRSISELADAAGIPAGRESPVDEQTIEEKLLAALLEANGELLSALGQFDDMERIAIERKTQEKSRKEMRMDRRVRYLYSAVAMLNLFLRPLQRSNNIKLKSLKH